MNTCKCRHVRWAIFSDLYGVWFPEVRHEWYEKDPETASEHEFRALVTNFDESLNRFDGIWFYRNPGRFHPLYKRLLAETVLKCSVVLFSHLHNIVSETT